MKRERRYGILLLLTIKDEILKRHAANIITLLRIPLSLCLLLPLSIGLFMVLYALAGITDMADGIIARRMRTQSVLGARLDSIADMVMMGVILYKLIDIGIIALVWPWLVAIGAVRIASIIVVYVKHRVFGVRHTWAGKLTGLLIFLALPLNFLISHPIVWWTVIAVAAYAAVEDLGINLKEKTFDPDKKHW